MTIEARHISPTYSIVVVNGIQRDGYNGIRAAEWAEQRAASLRVEIARDAKWMTR